MPHSEPCASIQQREDRHDKAQERKEFKMRDYEPEKMKKIAFAGIRRVREKAEAMEREGKNVRESTLG